MTRIVCGKFDNTLYENANANKIKRERERLFSVPLSKRALINFVPISTDGMFVKYQDETYKVREFLSFVTKKKLSL